VLPEDSAQFTSQKIQFPASRPDGVSYRQDAQLSTASLVRTTRNFRPDLPLIQEASNYSTLHPSGRFSSTSGWPSVLDKFRDFFPRHSYGKIAATVWTMWIPVRTRSSIRQVSRSKSRRSDTRSSDMVIACIWSTVRMTITLVRKCEASIWKLLAANVRPPGRQGNIIWTQLESGKNFSEIFGKPIA
jgi:hypothetical protein